MENFTVFTNYIFTLLNNIVSLINSNYIFQFTFLLLFCSLAIGVFKKIIGNKDSNGKGGVSV